MTIKLLSFLILNAALDSGQFITILLSIISGLAVILLTLIGFLWKNTSTSTSDNVSDLKQKLEGINNKQTEVLINISNMGNNLSNIQKELYGIQLHINKHSKSLEDLKEEIIIFKEWKKVIDEKLNIK
jgi:peptidoglycan hydrolase CwlO-like protein